MRPILGEIGLIDTMVPTFIFERSFEWIIPQRSYWVGEDSTCFTREDIVFFTDVCLPSQSIDLSIPLGEGVTALQAEILGISRSTFLVLGGEGGRSKRRSLETEGSIN